MHLIPCHIFDYKVLLNFLHRVDQIFCRKVCTSCKLQPSTLRMTNRASKKKSLHRRNVPSPGRQFARRITLSDVAAVAAATRPNLCARKTRMQNNWALRLNDASLIIWCAAGGKCGVPRWKPAYTRLAACSLETPNSLHVWTFVDSSGRSEPWRSLPWGSVHRCTDRLCLQI